MTDQFAQIVAAFPRAFQSESIARAILIYRRWIASDRESPSRLPDAVVGPRTKEWVTAVEEMEQVLRDRDRA